MAGGARARSTASRRSRSRARAGRAVEQLELFEIVRERRRRARGARAGAARELPAPPLHRVRRLSYSALSLFERCSYRYFAERVVGLRAGRGGGPVPGHSGLAATEIGDAVHALLERIDLRAPAVPEDLASSCGRATRP